MRKKTTPIKTFVIDLFCGAGGTSTAIFESKTNIEVVACINHDMNAILSHAANYPKCLHFVEDIRTIALQPIVDLITQLRKKHKGCKVALWASLECTNHSKAKGGQSRDADSRSLADHLFRYFDVLNLDFVWIENVREFMEWGPLRMKEGKNSTNKYSELAVDQKGAYIFVPVPEQKGIYYKDWVSRVKAQGFEFDWRILNSANYGAYTSRERFFAQFSKNPALIAWPEQTHAKVKKITAAPGLFDEPPLEKWKPVRDVLNLEDEGISIFQRKKPLSDNTLKRIYAGLVKFVANGDETFMKSYYSGNDAGRCYSMETPSKTLRTANSQAIVKCVFLGSYYGNSTLVGENSPCGTLTTKDRFAKIEAQFLDNQYGNSKPSSIEKPTGALTPTPKQNLITAKPWLINMNSSTSPSKDLNDPAPTITTARTHYLVNPSWFNMSAASIDNPCLTLIARMDKSPLYLVSTEAGALGIAVFESDSEPMVEIKKFMAAYGIIDVKMRMLQIPEMLRIQGFPKWYTLKGTQTEQKKYIGNSVEVTVGKVMFQAIDAALQRNYVQKIAA